MGILDFFKIKQKINKKRFVFQGTNITSEVEGFINEIKAVGGDEKNINEFIEFVDNEIKNGTRVDWVRFNIESKKKSTVASVNAHNIASENARKGAEEREKNYPQTEEAKKFVDGLLAGKDIEKKIDINEVIENSLNELKDIGYGDLKLNEFKKNIKDLEEKNSDKDLVNDIENKVTSMKTQMDTKRAGLYNVLKNARERYANDPLNLKRIERKCEYDLKVFSGVEMNPNDIINSYLTDLNAVGYGVEKLKEFKNEFEKSNNEKKDIGSFINYLEKRSSDLILDRGMQKVTQDISKKNYERNVEINPFYAQIGQYIDEQANNKKIGMPSNDEKTQVGQVNAIIEKQKQSILEKLKIAGYGNIKIDKVKLELEQSHNQMLEQAQKKSFDQKITDFKSLSSRLNANEAEYINVIEKAKQILNDSLKNAEDLTKGEIALNGLYAEQYNNERLNHKDMLVSNKKEILNLEFEISVGHPKEQQYLDAEMDKMKLHGFSEESIKKIKSEFIKNNKNKSGKEYVKLLNEMVNQYCLRNKKYIQILQSDEAKSFMNPIAEFYKQNKVDVIKELISYDENGFNSRIVEFDQKVLSPKDESGEINQYYDNKIVEQKRKLENTSDFNQKAEIELDISASNLGRIADLSRNAAREGASFRTRILMIEEVKSLNMSKCSEAQNRMGRDLSRMNEKMNIK